MKKLGLKKSLIIVVFEYDALNRITAIISPTGGRTAYTYDRKTGKISSITDAAGNIRTFRYNRAGELTGEYQDGELLHGYVFNSMNRLGKAWNAQDEEAEYFYNALGQRTGRNADGELEEYLLDLTKPYHNLLELQKGKQKQTFYYDFGVALMEEEGKTARYALSDDLGSPLRVLHRNGHGDTYGYDEFGGELYDLNKQQNAVKRYSRQGENQPFGYTGYRYDDISGTYFAQAREYRSEIGRFTAEDIIRGRGSVPKTLNRYGYCWDNPMGYMDLNGKDPITPQEAQNMAWDFLEDEFDKAVDEIENKVDTVKNDIIEGTQEGLGLVADIVSTVMGFTVDTCADAVGKTMDNYADVVMDIRDTLSKNTGTTTYELSGEANCLVGVSGGISVSVDWEGTVSFQISCASPFNGSKQIGFLNIGVGAGVMYTNAKNVDGLLGYGVDAGFGFGKYGIDLIGLDWDGDEINGFKVSVGKGGGVDVHLAKPYTKEIGRFNIYSLILKCIGRSEYGNRDMYDHGCPSVE